MADERVYVIPLRGEARKSPRDQRANRTINGIRKFVSRHSKVKDVKVSEKINQAIWSSSRQKPPGKVKVRVRVDDGVAYVKAMDEMFVEKAKREKKIEADKAVSEPEVKEGAEEKPSSKKAEAKNEPAQKKEPPVKKPKPEASKSEKADQHEKTEGASK